MDNEPKARYELTFYTKQGSSYAASTDPSFSNTLPRKDDFIAVDGGKFKVLAVSYDSKGRGEGKSENAFKAQVYLSGTSEAEQYFQ